MSSSPGLPVTHTPTPRLHTHTLVCTAAPVGAPPQPSSSNGNTPASGKQLRSSSARAPAQAPLKSARAGARPSGLATNGCSTSARRGMAKDAASGAPAAPTHFSSSMSAAALRDAMRSRAFLGALRPAGRQPSEKDGSAAGGS
eukprot:175239-Chlamydomonas_euryale.AAC.6